MPNVNLSLSLAGILAAMPPTAPTLFPARELSGGVVVDVAGETVQVQPGACYVPEARCLDYVRECERAKASEAELAKAPPPTGWTLVLVALGGLLAGFALSRVVH